MKRRLVSRVTWGVAGAALVAAMLVSGMAAGRAFGAEATGGAAAVVSQDALPKASDFLAISLVVGLACLGAGVAVAKVGSAALGAIVERPELLGRTLIFVGLAEGIAIYGLIFGILLLQKL